MSKVVRDYASAHMISFSGGRSSAYMTDRLLSEAKEDYIIVFANTGKEHEKTLEFVHNCDNRWGGVVNWIEYDPVNRFRKVTYETASRLGQPFSDLIDKRKFVPNIMARFCTQELKIRPIKWFMVSLGFKHWTSYLGIRADEPIRIARIRAAKHMDRWDTKLPMAAWGTTKGDVIEYWNQMPFDLEIPHHLGNCDMCFLKGKNKIKHIIKDDPDRALWWIEQERKTGGSFRSGYTYESLLDMIKRQPELFDTVDADIDCLCNID